MRTSPLAEGTVVVTGAARGLGAALAQQIARRGARTALLGHEKDALDAVAASLPGPAPAVEVDVTDPGALDAAARTVRSGLGRPSVVVANAGISAGGMFLDSDPAAWRRVIEVNLTGSAHTARFLPDLLATAGYFLQVASMASIGAAPLMSAYCASKAGVEAFAHALRAEVAHRGVGVGIAYPSWTDTDMIRDADRYAVLRELRAHAPTGAPGVPRGHGRRPPGPGRGAPPYRRVRAGVAAAGPAGARGPADRGAARVAPRAAPPGGR
ncbi:hypothetical protein GCM10010320_30780 [Streptomyces caelestis]|uniref:NAD(P)-dependent dehydrogenase (Short-subunit alcohol dehydrogenase family) n=1 Tax=Streptomyces caelestis TaxID=36816 RepID=A0A7W9HBM0_9ACTN|nr:NAD(P)-dependent dehydrogenase (short-subunit alcohol dehydrogenase family) [Streptomyces caelestis]GGW48063.1 hypothetical protein GCM10010320_30780 [Streptomyces caelestis]